MRETQKKTQIVKKARKRPRTLNFYGGIEMRKLKSNNQSGELLTLIQICELSNLGNNTVRRLAKEAGAERKIGKSYRINRDMFFAYIEKEYSI